MKKQFAAFSLLLVLCLAFCVPAHAAGEWSEDYYRAYDATGELTVAERDSLDEDCIDFVVRYHLDLVLLALSPKEYENATLEELADGFYSDCGFGWGEGHDGFLWAYDVDADAVTLYAYGAAEGVLPQDYVDFATGAAPGLKAEHGVFGVLYGGVGYLDTYLAEHAEHYEASDGADAVRSELPAWYPADPQHFQFYHDESAPRVVDNADIFTVAEEAQLEALITELRQKLQRDVVVYTDVTDYGLGKMACAEDFYDYNGYGCGEEYEGICLFIDMDPYDRGWWCCATGSETMALYTEKNANMLDDMLYKHMAAGDYAGGVAEWIGNVGHLMRTGRVSRGARYWTLIAVASLAIGSAFGGITLGVARAKMAPPKVKRDADAYIGSDSRIGDAGRHYLYTTTSRRYDPPEKRSSGGGSSGRSSYSGSHSGSSGRSHSGSGRSF